MPTKDRPLTDAQERALGGLAEADDRSPGKWHTARDLEFGWKPATYAVLFEMGLAKMKWDNDWLVQITPAGIALLATMGD
jgi:hypothetical protein